VTVLALIAALGLCLTLARRRPAAGLALLLALHAAGQVHLLRGLRATDDTDRLTRQIPLGQLEVVQPAALDDLQKMGGSLYRAEGPVVPVLANVQIRQGYLEASGVNPISETVQLIEASRSFETNINMIRFQDESLSRLLQSMTRR
jgi:flagellar basal body rod protein FlgG